MSFNMNHLKTILSVDQLAECGTQTPSLGHHKKHFNSHTAVNKTCKGASNSEDYWGKISWTTSLLLFTIFTTTKTLTYILKFFIL